VLLANDPVARAPLRVDAHHSDGIASLRADRTWDRRSGWSGPTRRETGATVVMAHIQNPS